MDFFYLEDFLKKPSQGKAKSPWGERPKPPGERRFRILGALLLLLNLLCFFFWFAFAGLSAGPGNSSLIMSMLFLLTPVILFFAAVLCFVDGKRKAFFFFSGVPVLALVVIFSVGIILGRFF